MGSKRAYPFEQRRGDDNINARCTARNRGTVLMEMVVMLDRPHNAEDVLKRPQQREPEVGTSLSLDDVDRRIEQWIAIERERTFNLLVEFGVQFPDHLQGRLKPGPKGDQGPPGFLPMVRAWQ